MESNKDLRMQYTGDLAKAFAEQIVQGDQKPRIQFYKMIGEKLEGKKLLDLCCGDGYDANYFYEIGANTYGSDVSEDFIQIAKNKYPNIDFRTALAENLPYEDEKFDVVVSKYAIMTSHKIEPIFNEIHRILKKGGELVYLVAHPFRAYLERKNLSDNYFKQKEVSISILEHTVIVKEPTHTMNEYFNLDFFSKFEMIDYVEMSDPASEQMYGGTHPDFFIVKARKK